MFLINILLESNFKIMLPAVTVIMQNSNSGTLSIIWSSYTRCLKRGRDYNKETSSQLHRNSYVIITHQPTLAMLPQSHVVKCMYK